MQETLYDISHSRTGWVTCFIYYASIFLKPSPYKSAAIIGHNHLNIKELILGSLGTSVVLGVAAAATPKTMAILQDPMLMVGKVTE